MSSQFEMVSDVLGVSVLDMLLFQHWVVHFHRIFLIR